MEKVFIFAFLIPYVMAAVRSSSQEEDYGPPQPYNFGYKVHDKDGDQWRTEVSDGLGKVEGTYGYVDNLGMKREVQYIADDDGFRAKIKTNEPGMDIPHPADVIMNADPPSDYDATIYGIEAVDDGRHSDTHIKNQGSHSQINEIRTSSQGSERYGGRPSQGSQRHESRPSQGSQNQRNEIRTSVDDDSKGFYKYHSFAEQSVPPVYVVDGHLQSPWFPIDKSRKN